ncbi:hypothetical protein Bca4012_090469 [Brassica carinata]|uniref:Uncharacterized protein n=1 Tax=Brassica carinata TaxID=52824 RepID=A0A8X7P9H9_BRACI|nr:hypothetical protein Bca52824_086181 [Brassica carinata]
MLSVSEPVVDHSEISQHILSSTVHYPVSTPHGHPAHQSIISRTSPGLIASFLGSDRPTLSIHDQMYTSDPSNRSSEQTDNVSHRI